MKTRRRLLAGLATTTVGFAGCTSFTDSETTTEQPTSTAERASDATTPPETTAVERTSSAPAETSTEKETTADSTTDTEHTTESVETPTFNETDFPVVRQDLDDYLSEGYEAKLRLWTDSNWQDGISEELLSDACRTFLRETDFATETAVALESRMAGGLNRWVVESIDGIGTDTLTIHFREHETGVNSAGRRLVVVRVPNEGTEPTRAIAEFADDRRISSDGT